MTLNGMLKSGVGRLIKSVSEYAPFGTLHESFVDEAKAECGEDVNGDQSKPSTLSFVLFSDSVMILLAAKTCQ